MRFTSKVDWWIAASVLLAPVAVIFSAVLTREPIVWVIGIAVLASLAALCWPCDYTLADEALIVRSGLIKWKVPYKQIERVEPTRNPLSAPAWSLDRIAISYGGKLMLISPLQKDEFMNELRARARLSRVGSTETFAAARL